MKFIPEYVARFEAVSLEDGDKINLGTGNDLQLYHDGSNSYIDQVGTGDLYIRTTVDDGNIFFQGDDGSGGVATYFQLLGNLTVPHVLFPDSAVLDFGAGRDLQIYHAPNNGYIVNNTGDLTIQNSADDKDIILKTDDGSGDVAAYITLDGSDGDVEIGKNTNLLEI